MEPTVEDLLIGGARIFFDDSTGYRELGNIPSISLTNAVKEIEHYTAQSGKRRLDKKIAIEITLGIKFQLDEFNVENLNSLFLGDGAVVSTFSGGSVVDEVVVGYKDRYFFTAKGKISSVVLTHSSGTPTYVLGTDYSIEDANLGIIKVISAGAITDGQSLKIDYSYAASASTRTKVKPGKESLVEGAARLVFTVLNGQGFQWIIPSCSLSLKGDVGLNSENWSSAEFELSPLIDAAVSGEPFGFIIVN